MKPTTRCLPLSLAVSFAVVSAASAELELGAPFSDNMMVQAGHTVPIWGTDEPGTVVTVQFADASAEATANAEGKWRVDLPAVEDVGPYEFKIESADGESLTLSNVIAGDVWLCSGQSNMQWSVQSSYGWEDAFAAADNDHIRLLHIPNNAQAEPVDDVEASWAVASEASIKDFSAVGYYFGKQIEAQTDRPIGLIQIAWGGSNLHAWLPADRAQQMDRYEDRKQDIEDKLAAAEAALQAWIDGGKQGPRPGDGVAPQNQMSLLYNGMTHPLGNLPITGVLWYQGESDAWRTSAYEAMFRNLVAEWREQFPAAKEEVVAYYVQLPNFAKIEGDVWPKFREMQRQMAAVEGDGIDMVVTIDVGDANDIHPRRKRPVAARLAALALRDVYDVDVLADSPEPTEATVQEDGLVRVVFDAVGSGLKLSEGDAPLALVLVDADGKSADATATLDGQDTVILKADGIGRPTMVRYAYAADPKVNVVNSEGLPMTPFVLDLE